MPDAITAFAPGLSYTLLTPSLPIFSASATKWNERGHGSASDIEPPAATSGVRADYMMVCMLSAAPHVSGYRVVPPFGVWRHIAELASR